jgi:SAM-dependent methyltransferase
MSSAKNLRDSILKNQFIESEYLTLYPDVAAAVKAGTFKSGYEHYEKHGKSEGRQPNRLSPRERAVFHLIDKQGFGLEIGPSHNPIAPKKNGYKVHIIDHLSANDLRIKYQDHGLNLDNIEEVDFIWSGQPLYELIGKKHCYDWIIASHVIEHLPDLISFLQQSEQLLKPNGVLSLVVPDKRYCFDYFQPVSSTGILLDAHKQKRTHPTPGQVFDHFANASSANGAGAWSPSYKKSADALIHTIEQADAQWHKAITKDDYVDVYCWRFTPESFALILSDINRLGLVKLVIQASFPTNGCEFYVSLGLEKIEKNHSKLNRLNQLDIIKNEI